MVERGRSDNDKRRLDPQGQRTLNSFDTKDLHQEVSKQSRKG